VIGEIEMILINVINWNHQHINLFWPVWNYVYLANKICLFW